MSQLFFSFRTSFFNCETFAQCRWNDNWQVEHVTWLWLVCTELSHLLQSMVMMTLMWSWLINWQLQNVAWSQWCRTILACFCVDFTLFLFSICYWWSLLVRCFLCLRQLDVYDPVSAPLHFCDVTRLFVLRLAYFWWEWRHVRYVTARLLHSGCLELVAGAGSSPKLDSPNI